MYDIAIIGAGINGCALAYELQKEGKTVLLLDMESIASGGSGAAGAFISPKFSKGGELKHIIGSAFVYSMKYYENNFSQHFSKTRLIHIAKDDKDSEILREFKRSTHLELYETSPNSEGLESISLDSGIVNAQATCRAMSSNVTFKKHYAKEALHVENGWVIDSLYRASKLILTTGAYEQVIKEPYLQLRGVWGHRIDIRTSTCNINSLHQNVSISPTKDGLLAIGATHDVHYHPQTSLEPYNFNAGREELLKKASRTIKLENVEVVKDYVGLRSGSFDYMPIVGSLVDASSTVSKLGKKLKVKRADSSMFDYYENLYMINGNGGYGFVLAPYLANILTKHIVYGEKLDKNLCPSRFFSRWAKRG